MTTTDLAQEVADLQSLLANAERERINPADIKAAEIRRRLEEKQKELIQAEASEAATAATRERQLALEVLQTLETEIAATKNKLETLQAEYCSLPGRLQVANYTFSKLLRAYSEAREKLQIA